MKNEEDLVFSESTIMCLNICYDDSIDNLNETLDEENILDKD